MSVRAIRHDIPVDDEVRNAAKSEPARSELVGAARLVRGQITLSIWLA
jgi:hypothetical protein